MTTNTISGSCLCEAVRYEADGPFSLFQYCHCSRCRRVTGSAHASNLFCSPAQFRWVAGENKVTRYALEGARHFATAFCALCGSNLPWTNKTGTAVVIPAGGLTDEPPLKPAQSIMWASRAPWYIPVSELPTYDTYPPRRGQ